MQARNSNLSIFHNCNTALTSTRPTTAAVMIEESTAFGVYLNKGVMGSKVRNITKDITMFEMTVSQPAMTFTAEREKDPT